MDEKSLIKKYQKEISSLKQELQQLRRGMMENPNMTPTTQEDLVNLKLQVGAATLCELTKLAYFGLYLLQKALGSNQ